MYSIPHSVGENGISVSTQIRGRPQVDYQYSGSISFPAWISEHSFKFPGLAHHCFQEALVYVYMFMLENWWNWNIDCWIIDSQPVLCFKVTDKIELKWSEEESEGLAMYCFEHLYEDQFLSVLEGLINWLTDWREGWTDLLTDSCWVLVSEWKLSDWMNDWLMD